LQISSLTSAALILALAHRYRGMVCEFHALHSRPGADGAGQAEGDLPQLPAGHARRGSRRCGDRLAAVRRLAALREPHADQASASTSAHAWLRASPGTKGEGTCTKR
jgi:hypothetical protein